MNTTIPTGSPGLTGTSGTDSQTDRPPVTGTGVAGARQGVAPTGKVGLAQTPSLGMAHGAVIAVAIMLVFVVGATMVAGTSTDAGQACVTLMFLLLLLQGIGHVNPVARWVIDHPLTPSRSTS